MENKCGIYSLRGYLYQILVFAKEILDNISTKSQIIYEGEEDIDIKNSNYAILSNEKFLIQVKSGELSKSETYGVIANWLLLGNDSKQLKLVYEKGDIKFDDDLFESFYNYISKNKKIGKNSKFSKCLKKYENKEAMNKSYENNVKIAKIEKFDSDEIIEKIYEIIKNNYSLSNRVKIEAFGFYFIESICEKVITNILKYKSYTADIVGFNQIILDILKKVKSDKYVFDLEKYDDIAYDNLISNIDQTFFSEIKKVSKLKSFIINNIQAELEYEIFRESIDIENIDKLNRTEKNAKNNRDYQAANLNNGSPNSLYFSTINMPLDSEILEISKDSKMGCYNFLTSSKSDSKLRISWELNDEEIE